MHLRAKFMSAAVDRLSAAVPQPIPPRLAFFFYKIKNRLAAAQDNPLATVEEILDLLQSQFDKLDGASRARYDEQAERDQLRYHLQWEAAKGEKDARRPAAVTARQVGMDPVPWWQQPLRDRRSPPPTQPPPGKLVTRSVKLHRRRLRRERQRELEIALHNDAEERLHMDATDWEIERLPLWTELTELCQMGPWRRSRKWLADQVVKRARLRDPTAACVMYLSKEASRDPGWSYHASETVRVAPWRRRDRKLDIKEVMASRAGFTSYAEAVSASAECRSPTYLDFPSDAPSDLDYFSDDEILKMHVCAFSASDDLDDSHAEGALLSASLLEEILSPDILAAMLAQLSNDDFWRQSRTLRLVCTALRDASYAHASQLRVVRASSHKLAHPRWQSSDDDALRYSSCVHRAAMLPDGTLCLCYEKELHFYAPAGSLIGTLRVPDRPRCVVGMGNVVFVGFDDSLSTLLLHNVAPKGLAAGLNLSAGPLRLRSELNDLVDVSPVSLAVDGERLYVACHRQNNILCFAVQLNDTQLSLQLNAGFSWFNGDRPAGRPHSVSVPSKDHLVVHWGSKIHFSEVREGVPPSVVRSRVIELNVPAYLPGWECQHINHGPDTNVVGCGDYIFIAGWRKQIRIIDIFRISDGELVQQGNFTEWGWSRTPLCLVADQRQRQGAPYRQATQRVYVVDERCVRTLSIL